VDVQERVRRRGIGDQAFGIRTAGTGAEESCEFRGQQVKARLGRVRRRPAVNRTLIQRRHAARPDPDQIGTNSRIAGGGQHDPQLGVPERRGLRPGRRSRWDRQRHEHERPDEHPAARRPNRSHSRSLIA